MEAAVRNKLMKLSGTMLASDQRFIRKFLKGFFNFTAFRALVFVYRHFPATPIVIFHFNYKYVYVVMSIEVVSKPHLRLNCCVVPQIEILTY
jgi:hypothetical protein